MPILCTDATLMPTPCWRNRCPVRVGPFACNVGRGRLFSFWVLRMQRRGFNVGIGAVAWPPAASAH
jgi:hypothetical protein